MRHLGTLPDEAQAQTFVDYVLVRGVKARADRDGEGADAGWAVWVYDDDAMPVAKEEFARFQQNPADAQYAEVAAQATAMRAEQHRRLEKAKKKTVSVRDRWNRPLIEQLRVTILFSVACIVVTMVSDFGKRVEPLVSTLSFARIQEDGDGEGVYPRARSAFADIGTGEVWRLVTPIFLHFSPLHLVGNLYWLFTLGGMIEARQGSRRLLLLVLALAVFSNVAQAWSSGPFFGGISGVTFGLFGYVWMRSRYDPQSGFFLQPMTVVFMMGWFLICAVGAVGGIANGAHGGGLFLGMLIGYWPKLWRDIR
jgi:GlpG protein